MVSSYTPSAEEQQRLVEAALKVRQWAYAPYSKFLVGAALLTDTGDVITGCNVENASYGLTICAERAAVFTAVAAGARKFAAVAIATQGGHFPCGACRQVLAEFGEDMLVLLVDTDHPAQVQTFSLSALLPGRFDGARLRSENRP